MKHWCFGDISYVIHSLTDILGDLCYMIMAFPGLHNIFFFLQKSWKVDFSHSL